MTSPVTRHLPRPPTDQAACLAAGIDTLDLGLYVEWPAGAWPAIADRLGRLKSQAANGRPRIWEPAAGVAILVHPAGRRMYRFRLEVPEGNLYLAGEGISKAFPNAYWSPASNTLWSIGAAAALQVAADLLRKLGGQVSRAVPSRCDLCVDLRVPGGLTLQMLRDHRVAKSDKLRPFESGSILETCYFGSGSSPIQARIYDKSLEIEKSRKHSMNNVWGTEDEKEAWRVEFQLRRPALKRFGIESVDGLHNRAAALWEHLTSRWLTLRAIDHPRVARRSILPFWSVVQSCASRFSGDAPCAPVHLDRVATIEWFEKHVAGFMPSIAALYGVDQIAVAASRLKERIVERWKKRDDSKSAIAAKTIKFGKQPHATEP